MENRAGQMNTLLDVGKSEHCCPHCLHQPPSVVAYCPHCLGTGLKARSIKRPGLPPPVVTDLGMCETCWETKTEQASNDPNNRFKTVVRTSCGCGFFVEVRQALDVDKMRSRPTVSLLFSEMTHAEYCAELKRETALRYGLIPTKWGFRRPTAGEASR